MTECSKCGDCCENIWLNHTKTELRKMKGAEAKFILKHWHRSSGGGRNTLWTCDRLDQETRMCTAYDDRPAVCNGFPWYGEEPSADRLKRSSRCSFWADLPAEDRPPDWVPVEIRMR